MLKAAVIGCGAIHELHACAIAENQLVTLKTVCDCIEERAKKTAEQFSCGYTVSFDEVLADPEIDVIHICTPHYLHAPMAIAAMEHGKDVFCEKPMAIHAEDARAMLDTAKKTGRVLGICFQNRYRSCVKKARELLDSGELGALLGARASVYWKRDRAYYASGDWRGKWDTEGGGVLINQSIHTLDLLNWLCGGAIELKAHVDTFELGDCIEVEDTAMVNLRFPGGKNALFAATNVYAADSPIEVELVCEKGTLTIKEELTVKTPNGTAVYQDEALPGLGKAVWGGTHRMIIEDFYRCLTGDIPFAVDGGQGICTVELLDAIYTSDRENRYVRVGEK